MHIYIMSLKNIYDDDGNPWLVKEYNGEHFAYAVPGNVKDHLDGIKNLACRDDDVIIMGYPRCGNHWTKEITSMLMRGEAMYIKRSINDAPIEVMEIEYMDKLESPRVVWTHMDFDRLPNDFIGRKCKIVSVIRNPKDAIVSLYMILQKYKDAKEPSADVFKGTFENFLQAYLRNQIPYENWFRFYQKLDRVLKENPGYPILMLTFEDMIKDLHSHVKKIADFLGVPYTEQLLSYVTDKCSFHNLRKEKTENISEYSKTLSKDGTEIYYRKGAIGDWKNTFTVALNERFDAFFDKELHDPKFKYRDMYAS